MKRTTLEKIIHTTLATSIWQDKLTSKDLTPLGQTRSGELPTWEIGQPDKKDDNGFVTKRSFVYYDYTDYLKDCETLELKP